ncbi:MAG: pyruvate:ferredoxin (flavodoxin) oxidoreductase [Puniceicoccaceae bacterium]
MISNSISFPSALADANEVVASVAYRVSELIEIYPITPSTPMAEQCDEWATASRQNIWGTVPTVVQMQSEGGVAGAIHGGLLGGSLSTTFTASQGLLLMLPNLYKIAGELTPFVLHVTARAIATHALSIFGDHSDVMACRQTGFALLASNSPQEAQDLAIIAHAATLRCRVPFLHFFDGFRTSHEIQKVKTLSDDLLRAMLQPEAIAAFRDRALTPDRPTLRGTAQNPDVFFQAREASNPFYLALPEIVQEEMDRFTELTRRPYQLVDYEGDPQARDVVVALGSGAETLSLTAATLNRDGQSTGVIKPRLYRPFPVDAFLNALPPQVETISVLDRTKEPGSIGEPLYLDIAAALRRHPRGNSIRLLGGRYGLGSKEFDPAMANAVFANARASEPKDGFTVGIIDDLTHTSLPQLPFASIEPENVQRCVFVGLGSDGTVGANKNTIKILGEDESRFAQAYFVYDSKKSGAMTVSHLRFGPDPIRAPYLIKDATFLGIHQFQFLRNPANLDLAAHGSTVLINSPYPPSEIWEKVSSAVVDKVRSKNLHVYVIDAYKVAREVGLGPRTNTLMQTCFFAISGVLERESAIAQIKKSIEKTYAKKGREVVEKNFEAVDAAVANLFEAPLPPEAKGLSQLPEPAYRSAEAPDLVREVSARILDGEGDLLPVSAFPPDGSWPTGTARWEKRGIAQEVPVWDPSVCIQCNKCVTVCPHATIRATYFEPEAFDSPVETLLTAKSKKDGSENARFVIQVSPEDCTGCGVCVTICPAKNRAMPQRKAINMEPLSEVLEREVKKWETFQNIPLPSRLDLVDDPRKAQFLQPLFEFSGACAGCGETPYLKLLTQLFGDRMLIANATGCSSIYGGNLPTTPYACDPQGRGPAWANSLFEDNAEFGFGMALSVEKHCDRAFGLLDRLADKIPSDLFQELEGIDPRTESSVARARQAIADLKRVLQSIEGPEAAELLLASDHLLPKQVWIVGGDGWAYDIGFGGLDHILASGRNVNILVLDTEVYSNTGGQSSKSTPLGAVAKFAASGKGTAKKDLALHAMQYGNVYVARVALGAKDTQTYQALNEAASYNGPSLVIAYSHCIAHGYNMNFGPAQQRLAVATGHWPLLRFDPRNLSKGASPLQLDSPAPRKPIGEYLGNEGRYKILRMANPERAKILEKIADQNAKDRYEYLDKLALQLDPSQPKTSAE